MPAVITPNEEAAALDGRNGFNFVFTTTPLTPWKDRDDDLLHNDDARV